jgi:hypothetical protein
MDVGLVPSKVLWRVDKNGFSVPKNELTAREWVVWKDWILSDRLDGLVSRRRRQKAIDYVSTKWVTNGQGKDSKSRGFSGVDVKLLDEVFRWASVGCFLETFPCKIEGGGDGS